MVTLCAPTLGVTRMPPDSNRRVSVIVRVVACVPSLKRRLLTSAPLGQASPVGVGVHATSTLMPLAPWPQPYHGLLPSLMRVSYWLFAIPPLPNWTPSWTGRMLPPLTHAQVLRP